MWVQQRLRRREFKLLKFAGEANPADLLTKHLESRAKLDMVVGLFSCRFMDGRAASAPALKGDTAAAINLTTELTHDPAVLPHLHLPEDIAELFPEAIVDPPRRGEDDRNPADELCDPVPAIRRLRVTRRGDRRQREELNRIAYFYIDTLEAASG